MNETPHFSFSAPFHGRELVIDFGPATRLVDAGLERDWLTSEITWGQGRTWIVHIMEDGRLDDAMIENPASVIAEELDIDDADVIDEMYALVDVAPDPDNPARLLIERAATAGRELQSEDG
jgi:hypothetical protein